MTDTSAAPILKGQHQRLYQQLVTLRGREAIDKTDSRADDRSAAIPLRSGGDGPPLFMFPGTDGSVGYLRHLASFAPDGMPVYGIAASGLVWPDRVSTSVNEIAENALVEIRRLCPNGPYHLAGYCMGGLPMFQAVHQLLEEGKPVVSAIHIYPVMRRDWDDLNAEQDTSMRAIKDFIDLTSLVAGKQVTFDAEHLRQFDHEERLKRLTVIAHDRGLLDKRVGFEDLRQRFRVYEGNLNAMLNYHPHGRVESVQVLYLGLNVTEAEFRDTSTCYNVYRDRIPRGSIRVTPVGVDDSAILSGHEPDLSIIGSAFRDLLLEMD